MASGNQGRTRRRSRTRGGDRKVRYTERAVLSFEAPQPKRPRSTAMIEARIIGKLISRLIYLSIYKV